MPNHHYSLGHTGAEYFVHFDTVGDVLHAVTHWVMKNDKKTVLAVNLNYDIEIDKHGATVLWEG